MGAYERRTVHTYLRDRTEVQTHSEGDEPERRLVVTPVAADAPERPFHVKRGWRRRAGRAVSRETLRDAGRAFHVKRWRRWSRERGLPDGSGDQLARLLERPGGASRTRTRPSATPRRGARRARRATASSALEVAGGAAGARAIADIGAGAGLSRACRSRSPSRTRAST